MVSPRFAFILLLNLIILRASNNVAAHDTPSSVSAMNKLNMIELENSKYTIDIENEMRIDSNYYRWDPATKRLPDSLNKDDLGYIQVRSKHGQLYECRMPSKSDGFDEDPAENDAGTMASFFGAGPLTSSSQKSQYNFSLINEKIHRFKSDLNNLCIYRVWHFR